MPGLCDRITFGVRCAPRPQRQDERLGRQRSSIGWLIDPLERQVLIYRTDHATEVVTGNHIAGSGPVEGFVLDLARVWNCYQD